MIVSIPQYKRMKVVSVGDILYCQKSKNLCVVEYFGEDQYGQSAVAFTIGKKKFHSSLFIIHRYYVKIGKI